MEFDISTHEPFEIRHSDPAELYATLHSRLSDSTDRAIRMDAMSTDFEAIHKRIAAASRRARQDFNEFQGVRDLLEALPIGAKALTSLAREMGDVRPLIRGLVLDVASAQELDRLERIEDYAQRIQDNEAAFRQADRTFWAVERASRAGHEAADAASALKNAAGEEGAIRLEEAFEKYAQDERSSAVLFRRWTIALLVAVAVLGAVLAIIPAVIPAQAELPWQVVVYRLSVLTALAALAAYLGRQSGRHRGAAAWADAIAVQLRAFPAFIQPIRGQQVGDAIYEAFGKRVMGSPPDFSGKSDDAINPTMSALIDAMVKQSRPTP